VDEKEKETFAHKGPRLSASASGQTLHDISGRAVHGFHRIATGVGGVGGGANVVRSIARPYHPLFSSPDRLQLPVQLAQLNQYWRLFYNLDPVIGGVIDMHSEMPFSNAYLIMDESGDNSKEILEAYEDMMTQTELLSWLPRITKEYFIIGEVFPFLFWDKEEGIWSHITVHNPDYVEVVDSPLVNDEAILTLRPSQEMRRILQSTDPRYIRLRQSLPPEMLALLSTGKNIPLDPLNASHIRRLAAPYDVRGTSIMGRMFRILMYEDAVFNAQIQQAQRHALPLRVFKIGDQNTGWWPTDKNMSDFAELLAEVEVDPLAALIYSHALQVEYHGIEGKQLKITQEWDIIERAKLIALGVSKAFLHGEVTYASANAGLQVLMMRYRTLRDMLLNDWIYKKVFATMAELRGFYRTQKKTDPDDVLPETRDPSQEARAERLRARLQDIREIEDPDKQAYEYLRLRPEIIAHNVEASRRYIPMHRTASRRSRLKKDKHLLYPRLQFEKRLDVRQDENILNLWVQLANMGWVSPRTVVQGAGLDFDIEQSAVSSDAKTIAENQLYMQSLGIGEGGEGGPIAGGPSMPPLGLMGEMPVGEMASPGGGEAGAPGSAGGETGPASAAFSPQHRKIVGKLPYEVKKEIEKLVTSHESIDLFVRG